LSLNSISTLPRGSFDFNERNIQIWQEADQGWLINTPKTQDTTSLTQHLSSHG